MSARVLSEGRVRLWLAPDDRGLAYGDGVFETLRVHEGEPVFWNEHWQRLLRGVAVLSLPVPDEARVRAECASLLADAPAGVLKIIVTRGSGGRGYRPTAGATATVVLSTHPLPAPVTAAVAVRWCQTPLAIQPLLAGIKHLNRLEQVLARAEWDDPGIFEGIVSDTQDRVVGATSANLFVHIGGRWLTPVVARCGIAGTLRAWVLANVANAGEADLSAAEVSHSDAIFLCNAVRGILGVRRLGLREWHDQSEVARVQRQLAAAHPAFAQQES